MKNFLALAFLVSLNVSASEIILSANCGYAGSTGHVSSYQANVKITKSDAGMVVIVDPKNIFGHSQMYDASGLKATQENGKIVLTTESSTTTDHNSHVWTAISKVEISNKKISLSNGRFINKIGSEDVNIGYGVVCRLTEELTDADLVYIQNKSNQ